jgi:hypothetical protein
MEPARFDIGLGMDRRSESKNDENGNQDFHDETFPGFGVWFGRRLCGLTSQPFGPIRVPRPGGFIEYPVDFITQLVDFQRGKDFQISETQQVGRAVRLVADRDKVVYDVLNIGGRNRVAVDNVIAKITVTDRGTTVFEAASGSPQPSIPAMIPDALFFYQCRQERALGRFSTNLFPATFSGATAAMGPG